MNKFFASITALAMLTGCALPFNSAQGRPVQSGTGVLPGSTARGT
jgi:Prokaryotic membrane lipoprotein lipid attachment site